VARALCARPKVLLLDEPSEGLFPAVTHRILDTVAELRRAGVAVLLVEQQVKSALRICDRILLIENGVIQHEARASELAANPVPLERYIGVHR
jgi:branched-chain amino acid transport system ATP-binding protein